MAEGTVAGGSPVTNEQDRGLPEAVAALPDVPGAVSTRPDVLAARSEVLAAREALAGDVDELQASARRTFDLRARIRGVPERVREDPARAAAVAAVTVGALAGVAALIVRSRRPKPHGFLPEEIEDAIGKLGKSGDKVRRSLEDSFASYLKERGFEQRSRRSRLGGAVGALAIPVATQVGRQLVKRMMAPPPDAAGSGGTEPWARAWKSARSRGNGKAA